MSEELQPELAGTDHSEPISGISSGGVLSGGISSGGISSDCISSGDISSGGISSPISALDALPVLMTELSAIVRRRIVLDEAFCTEFSLLCEAYDATLHCAHGEQSPIDRLILKLAKVSTIYRREWASVVTHTGVSGLRW